MADPIAALVVANVRAVRKRLRWSAQHLADQIPPSLGFTRHVVANLEAGRREHITVDELDALATALGVSDPWALARPSIPPCKQCGGEPPAGFRCMTCGAPDSEATA